MHIETLAAAAADAAADAAPPATATAMSWDSWDAEYRLPPDMLHELNGDSDSELPVALPAASRSSSRKPRSALGTELLSLCVSFNVWVRPQLERFLDQNPDMAACRWVRRRMYQTARRAFDRRLDTRRVHLSRQHHHLHYRDRDNELYLEPAGPNIGRGSASMTKQTQDELVGKAASSCSDESSTDDWLSDQEQEPPNADAELCAWRGRGEEERRRLREEEEREEAARAAAPAAARVEEAVAEATGEAARIHASKERIADDARRIRAFIQSASKDEVLLIGERTRFERHKIHALCGRKREAIIDHKSLGEEGEELRHMRLTLRSRCGEEVRCQGSGANGPCRRTSLMPYLECEPLRKGHSFCWTHACPHGALEEYERPALEEESSAEPLSSAETAATAPCASDREAEASAVMVEAPKRKRRRLPASFYWSSGVQDE